jgi:hypothetical protein
MKALLAGAIAVALIGLPGGADAAPKKKQDQQAYPDRSASKANGAPVRDIDETRYYERLSEKIPFGSGTWWRQRQLENPTP